MATLQNIRNKGGILVSIVIGLALVAFIIGDALSSGSSILNHSRNKVGEIAGESIDIQEFQQLITQNENMIKLMNGLPSLTEDQQRMVRENTWQQKVTEIIMGKEYEALGLGLSEDEMYDLLLGENMNPAIKQLFTDPNTGEVNKEQAREVVQNILDNKFGLEQKAIWLNMEEQIGTARRLSKYNALLAKGLYIPDAVTEDFVDNTATTVDISFIVKSYNTVSDSTIQVTSSEIKDYYHSHEQLFQQSESRQIAYVNFDITASSEDIKETEEWVNSLKDEFAMTTNVIEFANLTSEKRFEPQYYKKGELDKDLEEFAFSSKGNEVFGPYLKDNAYNIARVADRRMLPDSIRLRQIVIAANGTSATVKLVDSLTNSLRQGADFETMARKYSVDQNTAVNGGDIGWILMKDMPKPLNDTLFFAKKNDVKVFPAQNGFYIFQITDKATPEEKIQLGIIAKEITPSQQTINKIYNDARTFANNLNTVEDFNAAVTAQNQTRRIANLGKNDKTIPGIENARDLVREAYMTTKPGYVLLTKEKSPIFESGEKFTIAVLTDIKEEGLAPLNNEVASTIRRELIRKKKGEIIAKELEKAISGSESLLSVAQKANAEVIDASEISFNSFQIPGGGIEPKVISEAVVLDEGKISEPIIGNQGVYVVVVNTKTVNTITPEQIVAAKQNAEQTNMYRVNYQTLPSLIKKAGVVDSRYKFY